MLPLMRTFFGLCGNDFGVDSRFDLASLSLGLASSDGVSSYVTRTILSI